MDAAKKSHSGDLLKNFAILKNLAPERFAEVAEKINIHDIAAGRILFKLGDKDGTTIFLVKGVVELLDSDDKCVATIKGGSDEAAHPLAPQQPRELSARVKKAATVAAISTNLLEIIAGDALAGFEVSAIDDQEDDDWMSLMLRSKVFQKLPPVNISRLITGMQPHPLRAGDVVFNEGDEGDCYYTIKQGRCKVSRFDLRGNETVLAELGTGDGFGEDALLSDARRGATITMLTDGVLMKLAKKDFLELLNQPLATDTSYEEALSFIQGGAKWLDVRTAEEYQAGHIDGAINIPFATLRDKVDTLEGNTTYIIYCDDGHASNAAAFILSQQGLDGRALTGGYQAATGKTAAAQSTPAPASAPQPNQTKTSAPKTAPPAPPTQKSESVPKQTYVKAVEARLNAEKELVKIKSVLTKAQQTLHSESGAREHAEKEIARLLLEVESLKEVQANAQQQSEQNDNSAKLAADLESMQAQLDESRKALDHAEQQRAVLEQELAKIKGQLTDSHSSQEEATVKLRGEIESLSAKLATAEDQHTGIAREKDEALSTARRIESELNDLKRQFDTTAKGSEAMSAQIREAEQKKRAAVEEADRMRAELESLHKELEEKKIALTEAEQSRCNTAAETTELKQQVNRLNEQLAELTRQKDAAESRSNEIQQQVSELQSQHETSAKNTEAVNSQLADSKKELEQAHDETARLKAEISVLKGQLENAEQGGKVRIEELDKQVANLQQELEQNCTALTQLGQEKEHAEQQTAALQRELAELNEKYQSTDSERKNIAQQFESQIEQLKQELAAATRRAEESDQSLANEKAEVTKLTDKITALQRQLDETREATTTVERETERVQGELTVTRKNLEDTATDRDAIRQQLAAAETELTSLRKSAAEIDAEANKSEGIVNELRSDVDKLNAQLADVRNGAQQKISELEEQLREARSSHSSSTTELEKRLATAEKSAAEKQKELDRKQSDSSSTIDKVQREADKTISRLTKELEELNNKLQLQTDKAGTLASQEKDNAKKLAKLEKALEQSERKCTKLEAAIEKAKEIPLDGRTVASQVADAGIGIFKMLVISALLIAGTATGTWFYFAGTPNGETEPLTEVQGDIAVTTPGKSVEKPAATPSISNKSTATATAPAQRPIRTFQDNLAGGQNGPMMVELPGGSFEMGAGSSSQYFDERPQHWAQVQRFAISKYEITFAEYDSFAIATGRARPSDERLGRGNRPVSNVSWRDATAYAEWLSQKTGHKYRLPTEAEWEYAARGGTDTFFWWGNKAEPTPANCFDCGGNWDREGATKVGSFISNGFGLYDTASNVEEWVQDCYHGNFDGAPIDGSAWVTPGCKERVARGGSFQTTIDNLRSSKRSHYQSDTAVNFLGFRVVRER